MDSAPSREYRRGDLVSALTGNGSVPPGTVGKVVSVVQQPNLPKMARVEWTVIHRPRAGNTTRTTWTYLNCVEPLSYKV